MTTHRASNNEAGEACAYLTGTDLRGMAYSFHVALEQNYEILNALNVFPVPDGDTGANMRLTVRSVWQDVEPRDGATVSGIAAAMARSALLGARGNSGVILSQFFAGLARGLGELDTAGGTDVAKAFHEATGAAYKAVGNPTEGTMLTVIREAAEAAQKAADECDADALSVWRAASDEAAASVLRTPSLLPVLREAGVVDAGGQGLALMLEAGLRHLQGETLETVLVSEASAKPMSAEFLEATEDELYGYCTQFLIQGEGIDIEAARAGMAAVASSVVVVGQPDMLKVHVHTEDPGPALSLGVSLGIVGEVNIQNMDQQHQEVLAGRGHGAAAAPASLPIAVVAVAVGEGFGALLRAEGASIVVEGGQTMNPSVQDILDAIERAPSDNVVVLPNNKNVVFAANHAAELAAKNVCVAPSHSIPQGLASLLALNPERDLDGNIAAMTQALSSVTTGEVTYAARATTIHGMVISEGQPIGLLDDDLVAGGDEPLGVLLDVLRKASLDEAELVTLYRGAGVADADAEAAVEAIQHAFDLEVEVIYGGQPFYPYIFSVE